MGVTRLHRGVILWAGLIFFASATIAVALFNDLWTARHMGVVANFALAAGSWLTIALGKPFTLDYARQHTDPSLWKSPNISCHSSSPPPVLAPPREGCVVSAGTFATGELSVTDAPLVRDVLATSGGQSAANPPDHGQR